MNLNAYATRSAPAASKYPCLMSSTIFPSLIVLFIGRGAGIVMNSPDLSDRRFAIGRYNTNWDESIFEPFHGRVIFGTDIPGSLAGTVADDSGGWLAAQDPTPPPLISRDDFTGEQLRAAYEASSPGSADAADAFAFGVLGIDLSAGNGHAQEDPETEFDAVARELSDAIAAPVAQYLASIGFRGAAEIEVRLVEKT